MKSVNHKKYEFKSNSTNDINKNTEYKKKINQYKKPVFGGLEEKYIIDSDKFETGEWCNTYHIGITKKLNELNEPTKVLTEHINMDLFQNDKKNDFREKQQKNMMLNHPNIVKTYDFFEDSNKFVIVRERLSESNISMTSVSAADKIINLPPNKIKHYFIQILRAFDYAHNNNIPHTKLKYSDILFDDKFDVVKIKNFGWENQEYFHGVNGDRRYELCAPELINNLILKPDYFAVDVWSLG